MATGIMKTLVPVLLIIIIMSLACDLQAELYSFVDKDGVLHFTNAPSDSRYRELKKPWSGPRPVRYYQYDMYIQEAAQIHNLDPMLIKAVIQAESGFNRLAVSKKGAQGLMQLMPETAREMRVSDPFDPGENILGGTAYLKKMHNRFGGDIKLALAAYNAGPDRIKNNRMPRIPETVNYVLKVLKNYQNYLAASSYGRN